MKRMLAVNLPDFVAVHESGYGTSLHSLRRKNLVAFGLTTDKGRNWCGMDRSRLTHQRH
jgi:hypothetical protein